MPITSLKLLSEERPLDQQRTFANLRAEQLEELALNGRGEMVNVAMELSSGFNRVSMVRAANAFLARETIFVGSDLPEASEDDEQFAKRADSLEEVVTYLKELGYYIWAVDNVPGFDPKSIFEVELPRKSAFVYGREQAGLSPTEINLCDGMIYIPMAGAARSFNVAQASAIIMGEYTRQNGF